MQLNLRENDLFPNKLRNAPSVPIASIYKIDKNWTNFGNKWTLRELSYEPQ